MSSDKKDNNYVPAEYILNLTKNRFEVILRHFLNRVEIDDIYKSIMESKKNFVKRLREGCYKILAVKGAISSKVTLRYLAENELWLANTDKFLFEFDSDTYDDVNHNPDKVEDGDIFHSTTKPYALAFAIYYLIYNILINKELKKTMAGSEQNSLKKLKLANAHIASNTTLKKLFKKVDSYILKDGYKLDADCLEDMEDVSTEDSYASDSELDDIYNV